MDLVRNERLKYLATLVNTIAAAVTAAGVVAPLDALTFGMPGPISGPAAVLNSLAWLLVGGILHLIVRLILGGLRP